MSRVGTGESSRGRSDLCGMVRAENGVGALNRAPRGEDIGRIALARVIIQEAGTRGGKLVGEAIRLSTEQGEILVAAGEVAMRCERRNEKHAIEDVFLLQIIFAPVIADPGGVLRIADEA